MKRCLVFILSFWVFLNFSNAQSVINFIDNNFEEAVKQAKETGKIIFVDAYTEWCSPCQFMWQYSFKDEAVALYYNQNFINLQMDMDTQKGREFAEKFGVFAYPTLLFLQSSDSVIFKTVGALLPRDLIEYGQLVLTHQSLFSNTGNGLVPNSSIRIPGNDGRYTIGVRGQRLMYGYPYPYSTSHFIVKVDGTFASNYSGFSSSFFDYDLVYPKNFFKRMIFKILKREPEIKVSKEKGDKTTVAFMIDTLKLTMGEASLASDITFKYDKVSIQQVLSPVNDDLDPVPLDSFGKYYQVKYEMTNLSDKTKTIGLNVLFDTMIDDNDACRIDVFNNDEEIEPKGNRRSNNVESKYLNGYVPDRLLVYRRREKFTNDLTGDFHISKKDATKPDEMYIGSWPYLHSVVWKTSDKRIEQRKQYFDSAVLMKWDEVSIDAGETETFIIYYGLFNEGELELIPSNTSITGRDRTGKRIEPEVCEFTANPVEIFEDETTTLQWNASNPLGADIAIYAIDEKDNNSQNRFRVANKISNTGSIEHQPGTSKIYLLELVKDDKVLQTRSVTVKVKKRIPPEVFELNGQFTLGFDNQPILFGYPHNYSNSFFRIAYKNEKFTNNEARPAGYKYLNAIGLKFAEQQFADLSRLYYRMPNLVVTQSILKSDSVSSDSEFFEINYKLTNTSDSKIEVSDFSLFTDFNAYNSDDCMVEKNDTVVSLNSILKDIRKPYEIQINTTSNQSVSVIYGLSEKIQPAKIVVGHWQKLIEATENLTPLKYNDDSGLLQTWQQVNVPAHDSVFLGFTLKIPKGKLLTYEYHNYAPADSLTVYYISDEAVISNEWVNEIRKFIEGKQYKFVLIDGFTDLKGDNERNYNLAKRRTEAMKQCLRSVGVESGKILVKNNGEFYANQNSKEKDMVIGLDRKVRILLYR